ncbi:hypothetical protein BACCAP_03454 [Pseudoflavonifractor capillosus ATCC 29799]|uniref:Uncharacterized protein n=1 Tax=Pseudoflavonifractor capillosus ATCC 29799 TaxID=411467 RepID=A6NZ03_9FIRM|nr:hypothetical protein BACCAP_03454 [Pseudoflavonifractor capillosus ATCC 29799]
MSPSLFFCPNAGNGFEDIPKLQKGRYEHECKKAESGVSDE